jgi:hypothetical protein
MCTFPDFFFHLWHSVFILTVDVGNIGELHLAYFPFIYQFVDCRSQQPRGLRRRSWPLGYWDRGFESCSRHGPCICFCVVLSCAVEAFAAGCHSSKAVLPSSTFFSTAAVHKIFVFSVCCVAPTIYVAFSARQSVHFYGSATEHQVTQWRGNKIWNILAIIFICKCQY